MAGSEEESRQAKGAPCSDCQSSMHTTGFCKRPPRPSKVTLVTCPDSSGGRGGSVEPEAGEARKTILQVIAGNDGKRTLHAELKAERISGETFTPGKNSEEGGEERTMMHEEWRFRSEEEEDVFVSIYAEANFEAADGSTADATKAGELEEARRRLTEIQTAIWSKDDMSIQDEQMLREAEGRLQELKQVSEQHQSAAGRPVIIWMHGTGDCRSSVATVNYVCDLVARCRGAVGVCIDVRLHGDRRGDKKLNPKEDSSEYQLAMVTALDMANNSTSSSSRHRNPFILDNVFDLFSLLFPLIGVQDFDRAVRESCFHARVATIRPVFEHAREKLGKEEIDSETVKFVWNSITPGILSSYALRPSLKSLYPRPCLIVNGPVEFVIEAVVEVQQASNYQSLLLAVDEEAAHEISEGMWAQTLQFLQQQLLPSSLQLRQSSVQEVLKAGDGEEVEARSARDVVEGKNVEALEEKVQAGKIEHKEEEKQEEEVNSEGADEIRVLEEEQEQEQESTDAKAKHGKEILQEERQDKGEAEEETLRHEEEKDEEPGSEEEETREEKMFAEKEKEMTEQREEEEREEERREEERREEEVEGIEDETKLQEDEEEIVYSRSRQNSLC
ncbi:hypothetical protein GUITHDRAFT_104614 [Guillardia theta CCMP2712]|uniref:Uncharacterized protein n=1 Tax=Guillardia theta (strain CCMP2712) TaxID=905079 RepID=L1JNJ8_GUITC|nr:hypothetical protein GUITHDRAFT_104614 [Guillardia theta CCMP2712]EKX49653.1 hypothetical protein GUITHDRAFT_104614 [Guillardia theta CCMP2712]|eukprot:XP_005836633.1 hypothetical protein GUITHDRAFT_104614 [Guillardia theta CCMP2712]